MDSFFCERSFLAALKILDITPQQYADRLGITYVHLRRIITGKSKNIKISKEIEKITLNGFLQWNEAYYER